MVAAYIFVEEAEKLGLQATQGEVQETILGIPGLTDVDGVFIGQEAYENALLRGAFGARYTPAEFEAEIAQQILIQKFSQILSETTFVTDGDVEEAFRKDVEKAKISYLRLPADRFADKISVADAELDSYFQEHLAEYEFPERRVADYVIVDPALLRTEIVLADEEVQAYYDANAAEFTNEERVRARHILVLGSSDDEVELARARIVELRGRVEAGEDFAELAREFSEDEATRDAGGELGFFGRGRYSPALEQAAFDAQPGELLGPIESTLVTGTGFHLLEIQGRQAGGVQPFLEVEAGIRSRLLNERSRQEAESAATQLVASLDGESRTLGLQDFAAATTAARFETTEPFGRDDNVLGIGRGTVFTSTAFGLESDGLSSAFEVAGGWAVLHLVEIQDSRLPELDEVRDEVDRAVRLEKQEAAAEAKLETVLAELRLGQPMSEAARSLDVDVVESSEFGRDGFVAELGLASELSEAVFSKAQGDFGGPIATIDGPVVFQVAELTRMDPVELETRTPEFREKLVRERVDSLLASIARERTTEVSVRYLEDRLAALGVIDPPGEAPGAGL